MDPENSFDRDQSEVNNIPDKELKSAVILAEEIGYFRSEVEDSILAHGLPYNQWRSTYEVLLNKHPKLRRYKQSFDGVMDVAQGYHLNVENIWNETRPKDQAKDESVDFDGAEIQYASANHAKQLFSKLFGFSPRPGVQSIKGAVSIRFIVSEEDYGAVIDDESIHGMSSALMKMVGGVPIIVMGDLARENVVGHETEHIKNSYLGEARKMMYKDGEILFGKDRAFNRFKEAKKNVYEYLATDEILAFFSELEGAAFEDDKTVLGDNAKYVFARLVDPEGAYFSRFFKKESGLDNSDSEKKRYIENIKKGVESVVRLADIYSQKDESNGVRLAINVLEQFPLRSWPAVERLIETKH